MTERQGRAFPADRGCGAGSDSPSHGPPCELPSRLSVLSFNATHHGPKYVALWWGVAGATSVVHEMDVGPGGAWRIDMHTANGAVYPNRGEFLEVVTSERLVYRDAPSQDAMGSKGVRPNSTLNTVNFTSQGESTLVQIAVRFASAADLDRVTKSGFEAGIAQGLDRLARLIRQISTCVAGLPTIDH